LAELVGGGCYQEPVMIAATIFSELHQAWVSVEAEYRSRRYLGIWTNHGIVDISRSQRCGKLKVKQPIFKGLNNPQLVS
jgi:hypothetical protein